ncbi:hypothetical protein ABPG75_000574 [Micractinium tetrahymenae]
MAALAAGEAIMAALSWSSSGGGALSCMHRRCPSRHHPAAAAAAFSRWFAAAPRRQQHTQRHTAVAAAKQEPGAAPSAAVAAAAAAAAAAAPTPAEQQQHQQAAAPQPAQPAPSRLQQEVELLVALDVEYAHLRLAPDGCHVSLPAEVCAVDAEGRVLLYEHCNPLEEIPDQHRRRWRHVGGAPPALWQHAPPLAEVRRRLAVLLEGRILVGHHLRKDLAALALSHPGEAIRDTLQYRELQGRRGSGRKLADLSAERLGRRIQAPGQRHSPREDAQAAMDLYLREVHFQERYMGYDDLVQRHLAEILSSAGLHVASEAVSEGEGSSSSSIEGGSGKGDRSSSM